MVRGRVLPSGLLGLRAIEFIAFKPTHTHTHTAAGLTANTNYHKRDIATKSKTGKQIKNDKRANELQNYYVVKKVISFQMDKSMQHIEKMSQIFFCVFYIVITIIIQYQALCRVKADTSFCVLFVVEMRVEEQEGWGLYLPLCAQAEVNAGQSLTAAYSCLYQH